LANGVNTGSPYAAGIEGLVAGFLMGHDFRTQKRLQAQDEEDRRRAIQRQQEQDAQATADRARSQALQDFTLEQQYGVRYDPSYTPQEAPSYATKGDKVQGLRSGVGERLSGGTPGFRVVGPSAIERENEKLAQLRKGVGAFLGASPEDRTSMLEHPDVIAGLSELGILDDVIGDGSVRPLGFQRFEGAGGQYKFDPNSGVASPLMGPGGRQIGPSAGNSDTVSSRMNIAAAQKEIDDLYAGAPTIPDTPDTANEKALMDQKLSLQANAIAKRHGYGTLNGLIRASEELNMSLGVTPSGRGGPGAEPTEQQAMWDQAAEALKAQGKNPEDILGPRPR
jgi:hypothetical protein